MLRCRGHSQGVNALLFDESPSLSAPAAFGTFRVLHQVGSGVLGPVFRTSDPRRPELAAVKAFKLDLPPADVVRLADELRRLAASPPRHPALTSIIEAGLEGTTAFLATEYLIGDTLDVAIRRRSPSTLAEAIRLLRPVAEALDAAWADGIGHGSLHPRDVFVGSEAHEVKVTGVGVGQALERAGLSVPLRRQYAAPERITGVWDQRADVFSLGVLAHELLTGRRPAGPNEQDGVFSAGVSPEHRVAIRRVLSRALSERAEDRFVTNTALLEALEGVAAGGPLLEAVPAAEPVASDPLPLLRAGRETSATLFDLHLSEPTSSETPATSAAATESQPLPPPDDFRELFPAEQRTAPDRPDTSPEDHSVELAREAVDDLAYRSPLREEARGFDRPVPIWQPPPPARFRAATWLPVVLICLATGALIGYLASGDEPSVMPPASELARVETPAEGLAGSEAVAPSVSEQEPAASAPSVAPVAPAEEGPSTALPSAAAPPPPAERPLASSGGALSIRSQPAGAMVTLDGRLMGETPLVLRDLAAGPYLLQVARPGYAPRLERVTVPSRGREQTLTFALEAGVTSPDQIPVNPRPAAAAGTVGALDVDSTPRGARVIIDGRYVGLTPLRVPELAAGSHTVTLELANHSSVTRRTAIEPGTIAKLSVALR
jgi:serine/threonine-protein kinase